jgi:hypothetical protein
MAKKHSGDVVTSEKVVAVGPKIKKEHKHQTGKMFDCFSARELESYLQNYHPYNGWKLVEGVMNGKHTYLQVFGSKTIVKCIQALLEGIQIAHKREEFNGSSF